MANRQKELRELRKTVRGINQILVYILSRLGTLRVGDVTLTQNFYIFSASRRNARVAPHSHPWWEVSVLRQGAIEYHCEGVSVRPRTGQVAVFPAGSVHEWRAVRVPLVIESFMLTADPTSGEAANSGVDRMRAEVEAAGHLFRLGAAAHRSRRLFWDEAARGPERPLFAERLAFLFQWMLSEVVADVFAVGLEEETRLAAERIGQASTDARLAARMRDYLAAHLGENITADRMEAAFGYSKRHLTRIFRSESGCTINEFLLRKRLAAACDLLVNSDGRTNEVAYQVGFTDVSYFCKAFREYTCFTPQAYKREHRR